MKCLTLLAGSVKHPTQQQSGLIPITQQPHHVLPSRHNRYYGDTRAQGHFGGGLLLYRDELFENVNSCLDIKENIKVRGNKNDKFSLFKTSQLTTISNINYVL